VRPINCIPPVFGFRVVPTVFPQKYKTTILTICDSILCFKKRQNAIIICFIIKHYKQALFDGLKRVKALVVFDLFLVISEGV